MTVPKIKSRKTWSDFKKKWKDCDKCPLHEVRQNIVLARGKIPCDVLFCGEAPGTCLSGNVRIEVAGRDLTKWPDGVPVKKLVSR